MFIRKITYMNIQSIFSKVKQLELKFLKTIQRIWKKYVQDSFRMENYNAVYR